jgi:hypothetical protein
MSKINLITSQIISEDKNYDELIESIYETRITPEELFYSIEGDTAEEILKQVLDYTLDALVGAGCGDRKEIVKKFVKDHFVWDENGSQYSFQPVPMEVAFIDLKENAKL